MTTATSWQHNHHCHPLLHGPGDEPWDEPWDEPGTFPPTQSPNAGRRKIAEPSSELLTRLST
jgi:hypothetical protein